MKDRKRKQQAKILRWFRKIHRITGASLFLLFFIVSITGLLLGWKKDSGGYLMAKDIRGTTSDLSQWMELDDLHSRAIASLRENVGEEYDTTLNRIDVRHEKGLVKFVFDQHYTAIHLDGATGALLQIEKRRADFIENLHDGSYIDRVFNIPGNLFKLAYTTTVGLALLLFTITGFWLWYGPIRMRKNQTHH